MKSYFVLALTLLASVSGSIQTQAQDRPLRLAMEARPPAYGNPYTQAMPSILHTLFPVFDALTKLGDSGEVLPNLARSFTRLDDRTWRFELESDVMFANGEPFNAASFKANIDYLLSDAGQTTYASSLIPTIERVDVEDESKILITTKVPDPILPRRLSTIAVVPALYWGQEGSDVFTQKPYGTGPYQISDWGESDGIVDYEAFAGSWRGAPAISSIDAYIQSEGVARSQALLSGQVDMAMNVAIDEIEYLQSSGITVTVKNTPVVGSLAFSNQDPDSPFSDVRVRRALNHAIDREGIAKFIFGGLVEPTGQGTIPGVYGHNPDVAPHSYDPDRARALMAEAGYGDGLDLQASVTPGPPVLSILYQKVAQDLAAIGVKLDIQFAQGPSWVQMWFSGDWRDADLISSAWSNTTFMDAARGFETYSCLRPNPFFCEPGIVPKIEAAAVEFDETKRLTMLQDISKEMHDLAPVVYLFPTSNNLAHTDDVTGLTFTGIRAELESVRFAD